MAVLREQAQFDTAGAKGFDRGGFDWALQSLTYTLKIYDTSGVKVAEIVGDLKNPTLTKLKFELLQQGGCGSFSFTLAEPYTQATIDYDYRVEIYMFNHWSPWYTGKIINKPIEGTEKPQTYSGWGYGYELEKKIIDTEISPGNDIAVEVTSLVDTYITPYTSILKDADLIETVGHVLVATVDFEDEYAKEIFNRLTELAVDYKFGVNEDRKFYFQAIDTSVKHYWHVGKHLTEFLPEEDPSDLVKKVIAVYPEVFSDGYRLKITSEAVGYAGLYDKRFSLPEIVNPFSITNIASGITPSTNPAGTGAANLCDGDYSTLWESDTNQASGHYIKVDLGASYANIAAVVIDSVHDNAKDYNAKSIKIEISSDDITYTTMLSSDEDIGWKPTITFRPTTGRYVKISLTGSSNEEWKVGEIEIYQLDLTDAQRWADWKLSTLEDVKKRATARMAGVDKFLIEKPVVAPIRPIGKARVFDRNGTAIDDYQIIACRYSLSSGGFNLDLELGAEEVTTADEMKDMERKIRENENTGVRRAKNLSLSKGFQLDGIKQTYIGRDSIQTPHFYGGQIVLAGGKMVLGLDAISAGKHGLAISDGTYYRVLAGMINGDYTIQIRDSNGVLTVDLGEVTQRWRLIQTWTCTSPCTSHSFTGLTGNTDIEYEIRCRWIRYRDGAADPMNYILCCNDDTAAHYGFATNWTVNGVAGGSENPAFDGIWIGRADENGELSQGKGTLHATSSYVRTFSGQFSASVNGADIERLYNCECSWTNTANEITSLVFYAETVDGIGAGSQIDIYARIA